jgi:hypothetical protein
MIHSPILQIKSIFHQVLSTSFVFGFDLQSGFCGPKRIISPFYWLRIRVGHPCQGLVAKPLNIKALPANNLYLLLEFHTGTPNIE